MFFRKYRYVVIIVFGLLAVISGLMLKNIRFEFSFDAFIPPNDPEFVYYKEFKQKFAGGGSTLYIGVHNEAGGFRKDFVDKLHKLCLSVRKMDGVQDVSSLTLMKDIIYDERTPIPQKVLNRKSQETLDADSVRIMDDGRFVNAFISHTGKTHLLVVGLDSARHGPSEEKLVDSLNVLLPSFGFDSYHLAGFPIARTILHRTQQQQFSLYTFIASMVLFISMIFIFGRFWGILIATGSVLLGMLYFLGLYGGIGRPFDLMGTLYPILLAIVGTSDVVHIMTKYVDERREGIPTFKALKITLREIGLATFMTSITTAVGFASLYVSKMPPIKYFGLFAALGIFIAFITVALLTTSFLSFVKPEQVMRQGANTRRFPQAMAWMYRFTRNRQRGIVLGTLIVVAICGWGISKVSLNLHEVRDFPHTGNMREDFNFLDAEFHGVNSVTMAINTVGDHKMSDIPVQRELHKLENYLAAHENWGSVWSPLVMYKLANRFYHGNDPEYYRPAMDSAEVAGQRKVVDRIFGDISRTMVDTTETVGRLSVKIPDVGSQEVKRLTTNMKGWITENIDHDVLTLTHTGSKYLFDTNQEWLVRNLLKSLGLAFLIVSFFMGLIFKNLKMVVISLIPNVIPLLVTAALIGFMGFELDPKIAIVFTIAFGIAVDDTIHFLTRFKIERDKGATVEDSIRLTFEETGKAIVITTIILFSGFITLVWSAFPPTFVIGFLIAVTLVVALFADFLLLPLLLRWTMKDPVPITAEEAGSEESPV